MLSCQTRNLCNESVTTQYKINIILKDEIKKKTLIEKIREKKYYFNKYYFMRTFLF